MTKNYLLWTELLKVSEERVAWWQEKYNEDPSLSNEIGLRYAYTLLYQCKKTPWFG